MGTDEWVTFLANAIGGLRQAALRLREKRSHYEEKTDWFRRKKGGVPRENSVTRALADMFDQIRAEQAVRGSGVHSVDLRHISVQCERPRPKDSGISDHAKPTDLSLVLLKDNELDLRLEAKTVLKDAEVSAEYLGTRGLLRFDDAANPYTLQPYGAMLAYVVDLDAATWTTKINAALTIAVGADRSSVIRLGDDDHQVSHHNVTIQDRGSPVSHAVAVIHFVLEIDAKPSLRP